MFSAERDCIPWTRVHRTPAVDLDPGRRPRRHRLGRARARLRAPTGSGKTLAAFLCALDHLAAVRARCPAFACSTSRCSRRSPSTSSRPSARHGRHPRRGDAARARAAAASPLRPAPVTPRPRSADSWRSPARRREPGATMKEPRLGVEARRRRIRRRRALRRRGRAAREPRPGPRVPVGRVVPEGHVDGK
jgi:hypothetical protein